MGCESTMSEHGGLFSLDLSSHGGNAFSKAMDVQIRTAELQGQRLAEYALPTTTFETELLEAVRERKQECTDSSGLNYTLLAELLGDLGYLIQKQAPHVVCHCKTKQKSHKCLEKLTHTYLLCLSPLHPHQQADLIIEPRLREQFEIAHPTEPYKKLLEHLPGEFVGSGARLRSIVEAVSLAMAEAFRAQDMSLPPWRRASAALSKWNLDDSSSSKHKDSLIGGIGGKQPLKEQLRNDFNLPKATSNDIFAKASIEAQRFLGCSPRQGSTTNGLENTTEGNRPKISLLARNLADMATLQKARRSLEGSCSVKSKIKRAPSWDFSGLPPINTVRRSGKVL